MFGELIHNPQVVQELEEKGIQVLENLESLTVGDIVIIRAHGISNKIRKKLLNKGVRIIDGSCPFVTKAHLIAENFMQDGYQLVIIGNENHPEIRGIYEDFPDAVVIKNVNDVDILQYNSSSNKNKFGVICQTTIKQKEVEEIVNKLQMLAKEVVFENTICNATYEKQEAARKLAKKMDVMIVVGGKKSNNTKMLWEICDEFCKSYLISDMNEIKAEWFKGVEKVGITGGASTPMWLIEKVKERMEKF